ncbi:MAG: tRNA 5-methoxyuridine(34) synthase CmoB [Methylothermaceae bacteria B42]|nr:MAG: tRNA 5-methoxyuridine(34) synthase CmoB [Methylothermaceae bacteria B42]HHJ38859.1 tRNA 5-methoxyuridine(34)/uridine 5-oxyacetic acid(34) synthase CmoB [Methylothermaceae bacterium]
MTDPLAHDFLTPYQSLIHQDFPALKKWRQALPEQIKQALNPNRHRELPIWWALVQNLPPVEPSQVAFDCPVVKIGQQGDLDETVRDNLEQQLHKLHPWRKGPFEIFGIFVDTEWRSDFKWARLESAIQPLHDRRVLDVGAGNGYHCWRMLGAGAKHVIGIDPGPRYVTQFLALKKLAGDWPVDLLPLTLEDLPPNLQAFDSVFSMGVLYHRRSPFDHLYRLKDCLRQGGELILETLVIEGAEGSVLVPENRYAKMRNVWFIPSVPTLATWLKRVGFHHIRCIDVNKTTTDEQRSTDWMRFQSLPDFLDPEHPNLTVEGYPAPRRAIFLAEKP